MLKNKLNWTDFKFEIKNTNFSTQLFENKLNIFWKEVVENKLQDNQHIWLLFRLQWSNNNYVTIGKLQKLNKEDKKYLFDYILQNLEDKSDYYKETILKLMIFSYTIKKGKAKDKINFENLDLRYQNYQHHKLPITMNPLEYGKLITQIDNRYIIQINKTNIVDITQYDYYNHVKLFKQGDLAYDFKDHKIDDNTFIRSLDNKKFTFKNNELILLAIDKTVKFIEGLKNRGIWNNKIITLDIETYIKDGVHIPYCICWYDGVNTFYYYLTDFKNSEFMIIQAIKDFMIKKYDNYKIYIHNLAGFDGIFLLKILVDLGVVKPLIHNDKIISIGFKFNGYDITFKDSQQLLLASLAKLGKAFGVQTQKSIFPHLFVNENNLNYVGQVPAINFFNNLNHEDYNNYKIIFNNNWSLKNELFKYCEIDCISLYQIIIKFSSMIFELFKIDIHKYPTLSSLAFSIFRTHFLRKDEVPQLTGQIANDIRQGYTGGAVDMYQPFNDDGTKVYCYDVNSLYPYIMKICDMPTGKPTLFYGDIRKVDPNAFGFFYCNITAPDNLKHPILQTHVKTHGGIRTIAPLGQWSDMIFSAEMDNAIKFGYKFEILWGYKFKPKNIFKGYVDVNYNLRLQYPKSHPLNLIAKLLFFYIISILYL